MNRKSIDPMDERHWRFLRQSPREDRNLPFVEDCPAPRWHTDSRAERWRHWLAAAAWTLAAVGVVVVAAGSADAKAETIAVASDADDRTVYLTDETCEMDAFSDREAYKTVAVVRGRIFVGCWGKFVYGKDQILVAFPDGTHAVLGIKTFKPVKNAN